MYVSFFYAYNKMTTSSLVFFSNERAVKDPENNFIFKPDNALWNHKII